MLPNHTLEPVVLGSCLCLLFWRGGNLPEVGLQVFNYIQDLSRSILSVLEALQILSLYVAEF